MFHDMRSPETVDWGYPVDWSEPLNRGLVSWYLTVPNRMGWGTFTQRDLCIRNNGTLTNFTDPNTSGWRGPAGRPGGFGSLLFDGSDDYVEVATSAINTLTVFSVAAWVYHYTLPSGTDPDYADAIIDTGPDPNANQWVLYLHGAGITAGYVVGLRNSAGTYFDAKSTTQPVINTWYHVAATFDGDKLRIFVNGKLEATSSSVTGTFSGNANPVRMGRSQNASPFLYALNGLLDAIRIYNRDLNAAEVAALYADDCQGHRRTLRRLRRRYAVPSAAGGLLLRRRRMMA